MRRPSVSALFTRRTKSVVMSLQTIKEGHLYKRGKINTEWRLRLFVLNGKQLAYFKGGVSVFYRSCSFRHLSLSLPHSLLPSLPPSLYLSLPSSLLPQFPPALPPSPLPSLPLSLSFLEQLQHIIHTILVRIHTHHTILSP